MTARLTGVSNEQEEPFNFIFGCGAVNQNKNPGQRLSQGLTTFTYAHLDSAF